jgi:hypothetical protein
MRIAHTRPRRNSALPELALVVGDGTPSNLPGHTEGWIVAPTATGLFCFLLFRPQEKRLIIGRRDLGLVTA